MKHSFVAVKQILRNALVTLLWVILCMVDSISYESFSSKVRKIPQEICSTIFTVWQLIDRLHSSFIHPKRHDVTKMASSLSQIRLGNYENVTHTKTPLIYTTRLQNGAKSHIHLLPSIFIEFFHCSYQLICNNSIKTQMNQGDFPVFFVRMTSQIGSLYKLISCYPKVASSIREWHGGSSTFD